MSSRLDLTNQVFNMWTVLSIANSKKTPSGQTKTFWKCQCKCGVVKDVYTDSLKSGKSQSCGCIKTDKRKPYGLSARRDIFCTYRSKCKRNKIDFNLTEDEFNKIISKNCYYCDKKPSNIMKKKSLYGGYVYNGIDRVNNNLGYTLENTVTSCKNCNLAKRQLTQTEFFDMVKRIYEGHLINE